MSWSRTTVGSLSGRSGVFVTASLVCVCLAALAASCAPHARMCASATSHTIGACGASSACVAGRCQLARPGLRPAIDAARRMVVRAVDLAYVRRGHTPSDGARPPLFVLGAESAVLLMRFDVVVQPGVKLVEAYVILRRAFADSDTHESLLLHPTRIVEAWDGRSTAWASRPRVVEGSAPTTLVHPNHPSLVRLDVLDLVREWPRLDGRDHGLAVVAENEPRGGMAFAFGVPSAGFLSSSAEASPDPDGVMADGVMDPDIESEPALELYFR